MAIEATDKDFVTIRVSKKIGAAGIRNLESYARFLEINRDAPKKVSKKKITVLADEITAAEGKNLRNNISCNDNNFGCQHFYFCINKSLGKRSVYYF